MNQRKHIALVPVLAGLAFLSLNTHAQHAHDDHSHGEHGHGSQATIKTEVLPNENHAAGKTASTVIRLAGPNGQPVTLNDLEEAHTEKLHLLIVDDSLTDYHHEHPVPADRPGEYRFEFKPKHGGTYHVWADVLPTATGKQEYSKTTLKVAGTPGKAQKTTNTVAELDGYRFEWATEDNKPLRVGGSALVKVRVNGSDGQPFKQLEPVMGAYAHMVAFPTDLKSVTHVHPTGPEPTTNTERGGSDLSFHVVPEQAGFQKFYLQTQIGGRDKFVAFGVDVVAGSANAANADAMYTCPMHPEVRQKGPGKCPKCGGMALAPENKPADKAHHHSRGH
ncbi:MAG TPA: heavy metal-binding domain-containing protein [Chthoniobacterales bacterium]|nr:heavy metal-binding domain-containing protein [Chthoniobacterales bacterium]